MWSRERESREVFLSSSLRVGDRTLYCSFDLGSLFYEPVAPPFYQYFATVISSAVIPSSL